jgi:hypothetical protein
MRSTTMSLLGPAALAAPSSEIELSAGAPGAGAARRTGSGRTSGQLPTAKPSRPTAAGAISM